jgi:hypothetical protein
MTARARSSRPTGDMPSAIRAICHKEWLRADMSCRVGCIPWNGKPERIATWRDFIAEDMLALMDCATAANIWEPGK